MPRTVLVYGDLYVLSNPSLCLNGRPLVKIGFSKSARGRAAQLYTTGVPTPFVLCSAKGAWYPAFLEKLVHKHLRRQRVNTRREFFVTPVQEAEKLVRRAAVVSSFWRLVLRAKVQAARLEPATDFEVI
jgi:hypothetical protein